MTDISKLVSGFNIFKSTTYKQKKDVIDHLLEQGQKPKTLVISCVDIRMSPAEIFSTNPGELYVVSNIGGIVPPYSDQGVRGVISAIEHAVTNMEVENIVILGHAKCSAMKMIMSQKDDQKGQELSEAMKAWFSVVDEVRDVVLKHLPDQTFEEQCAACERESVVLSLSNLLEYPCVAKRVDAKNLHVFGWHFNIEEPEIIGLNPDNGNFEKIV